MTVYTYEKEINFPHIPVLYKGKGFLIDEEMRKYLVIIEEAVNHI
jgi:hypothetical protein